MRKHYCVYVERFKQCRKLSDAELGRLHRALMDAYETGERQELGGRESFVFDEMYEDVAQDAQKQDGKSKQAKEAASLRWDKVRTHTDACERIRTHTDACERIKPLQDKDFPNSDIQNPPIYNNISNTSNTSTDTLDSFIDVKEKKEKKEKDKKDIYGDNKGGMGGEEGAIYREIVDYLNEKAGTRYRPGTPSTKKHIHARLADGYTLDDFRAVIDKKCAEWLGTEMAQYLRPETLFGGKFEAYLNQPSRTEPKKSDRWGNIGEMV